jgi:hypothetical protein
MAGHGLAAPTSLRHPCRAGAGRALHRHGACYVRCRTTGHCRTPRCHGAHGTSRDPDQRPTARRGTGKHPALRDAQAGVAWPDESRHGRLSGHRDCGLGLLAASGQRR